MVRQVYSVTLINVPYTPHKRENNIIKIDRIKTSDHQEN